MKSFLLALFFSAVAFCNCLAQSAQKGSMFNAGFEVSTLTGKSSSSYNYGLGVSIKYEYRADSNFYFTLSAGLANFQLNDHLKQQFQLAGMPRSSYTFLPLKIGGKFYITKGFFGEVQLGNTFPVNVDRLASDAASAVTFSPGIGYVFNNGLELGARYEGWFTSGLFSQYAFRAAYRFKL